MYEDFPPAVKPADDAPIWRYMDFTKFVSMLEKRALFFRRADLLDDPFEGALPPRNFTIDLPPVHGLDPKVLRMLSEAGPHLVKAAKLTRQTIYVNCWHGNAHESAAMWRLYLKSDEGVAVRSTFGRLKECFHPAKQSVSAGKVAYIDYENDRIPSGNALLPCLHKRMSFAHEQEVRAFWWDTEDFSHLLQGQERPSRAGVLVPVDLDRLIERVYVSPTKQLWFAELVAAVLARYGHRIEVKKSRLIDDPIW